MAASAYHLLSLDPWAQTCLNASSSQTHGRTFPFKEQHVGDLLPLVRLVNGDSGRIGKEKRAGHRALDRMLLLCSTAVVHGKAMY